MKIYGWYPILMLLSLVSGQVPAQEELLAYKPDAVCRNYLNITGNTNINRFEFRLDFPSHKIFPVDDAHVISEQNRDTYEIPLPVKHFEANNQLIYHDFLELVKANLYPLIIIGIGYEQLQDFLDGEDYTVQNIKITLAGVTREYPVSFVVDSCAGDLIYISGYKNIKLTDFNIEPPEKFQGLVKVKDDLLINFGFVFLFRNQAQNINN